MRFSSILSLVAASLSTAIALLQGRYLYVQKDGKYRLAFDVYENKSVAIVFDTPAKHFIDGRHDLIHQESETYSVAPEVVKLWRREIQAIYPEVHFQTGDLTRLTFTANTILYVTFQGRVLRLFGDLFPLEEGTFVYPKGSPKFPYLQMTYTVQKDASLNVQFMCSDNISSNVSLGLTEAPFKAYDLGPPRKLTELREEINRVCPLIRFEVSVVRSPYY